MYAFSFFGKVCLLLMIRWIAKQKRFLFFLVQKANCMSESSFMLRDFIKYMKVIRTRSARIDFIPQKGKFKLIIGDQQVLQQYIIIKGNQIRLYQRAFCKICATPALET